MAHRVVSHVEWCKPSVPVVGWDTDALFERFTEQAREAVASAQGEAREMGHGAVGVEHLLLGLFSDQDGVAGGVFADFGLTVGPVRDLVRERIGVDSAPRPEGELPFSPEAKDVLRAANRFGLGEPGTEHVLLVIVRREEGGACEILRLLGADPRRIRFEAKKRAWPADDAGPDARPSVRHVGSVPLEGLGELESGE
jgi:ATP-dependent Clp protease ATP-binding subunit ClpA